jgi:putative transposase
MTRTVKVNLGFMTARKRAQVNALLQAYRGAVNFYIGSLWLNRGNLDAKTLSRLTNTRLTARYKWAALRHALSVVIATKLAAKERGVSCRRPLFGGPAILNDGFIKIEDGHGTFDLAIRLSTLRKQKRITILTKKTAMFNKWNKRGRLVQGGALSENELLLWFDSPDLEPKKRGDALGVDIGVRKLLSDSDGNHYGTNFKELRDKIRRKCPGSRARKKAHIEREQFINLTVKALPFDRLAVIGLEDLNDLKRGKKKGRGKSFRKAMSPWTYRHCINRIEQLAQENRVLPVRVDPANTSRICPACGAANKENRKGEVFRCITCNHTADADHVGALNILARTRETLRSMDSLMP